MDNLYRVSASSKPVSVAGAMAGSIRDGHSVALQAIGAGAVNQAIKAIAISRNYLARDGLAVICMPEFVELDLDGNERTAVRFHIDQPGKPFPAAKPILPREPLGEDLPHGSEDGHNGRCR